MKKVQVLKKLSFDKSVIANLNSDIDFKGTWICTGGPDMSITNNLASCCKNSC